MSLQDFSKVPMMRKPDKSGGKTLNNLKKRIEAKYNVMLGDRHEFYKWSIEHLAEFWSEVWDFTEVRCSKKFDQVIDLNTPMSESPEWFRGARLNFAENLLKYNDDRVALISAGEDKDPEYVTFHQMNEKVREYAAAFRKFGIKKGDVVACYISNRLEPVFAMNAVVSIGAIWTGNVPLLGAQVVINRFQVVKPKILLTIDRFKHDHEEIDMLHKVKEIVNGLPSLEKVLIVPSKPESKSKDISGIRDSCFLDVFLESGRLEDGTFPPLTFEQVSFSHPVSISFTSGTTGLPKPIIHGCGTLFSTVMNFCMQLDVDRDSVWFCMSPAGWATWNMLVSVSFCGVALLFFEGLSYFLSPTHFWDMVDEFGCSHMFLPISVIEELEKRNFLPTEKNHLRSLKVLTAGGSVVKPRTYDSMYRAFKNNVLFSSLYGATESMGLVLVADPTMPVYRGEIPVKGLGADIRCVDERGHPIEGKVGELIISQPYPSLPIGIWNDTDGIRYKKTYFQTIPGKFSMNDLAVVNPINKGFVVRGRSDETLKQRGKRFGSSEIYNIVDVFPQVRDSLCVAQYNKDMDERAVLFLKMRESHQLDENLLQRIRKKIANELSPAHVPDVITITEDIPYSMNGKKLEIIVKNIINNRPYNTGIIRNPESLKNFFNNSDIKGF